MYDKAEPLLQRSQAIWEKGLGQLATVLDPCEVKLSFSATHQTVVQCIVLTPFPPRQRGAIGLFAALVMLLAVLFVALAVDTGRLELEKRRLQKIADMAALDASRALCSLNDVPDAAQASAVRNGYTGNLVTEGGVKIGTAIADTGGIRQFTEPTDAASANAVEVTTQNTVQKSLVAGGLLGGTVTLTATGTAKSGEESIAGISAGSFLARINTGDMSPGLNSLLTGLLGIDVSLDLISYKGIAALNISPAGFDQLEAQGGHGRRTTSTSILKFPVIIG